MKINKKKLIQIVVILLVIAGIGFALFFTLFKTGILGDKKINLEAQMTTMVTAFYDKNIKGKIIGVHKQIVTLEDLQNQEYDISGFINAECSLESYSYVVLDNPQETDVAKIKYTIEHHLDCAKQ